MPPPDGGAAAPDPIAPGPAPGGSLRAELAEATRPAHQRLHRHKVLKRLFAVDLTQAEYLAILDTYRSLYAAAETARVATGRFQNLTLTPALMALRRDGCETSDRPAPDLALADDHQILGALYVLHGARFGAQHMRRALRRSLPGAPHHFFGLAPDPTQWAALLGEIEVLRPDPIAAGQLIDGADLTFQGVETAMTRLLPRPL